MGKSQNPLVPYPPFSSSNHRTRLEVLQIKSHDPWQLPRLYQPIVQSSFCATATSSQSSSSFACRQTAVTSPFRKLHLHAHVRSRDQKIVSRQKKNHPPPPHSRTPDTSNLNPEPDDLPLTHLRSRLTPIFSHPLCRS